MAKVAVRPAPELGSGESVVAEAFTCGATVVGLSLGVVVVVPTDEALLVQAEAPRPAASTPKTMGSLRTMRGYL
jgi:hypothetical protein